MVGWLVGLVSWLFGGFADLDCLVVLVSWLDKLVGLVGRLVGWLVGKGWLIRWLVGWLVELVGWSIGW